MDEAKMTDADMKQREKIVKSMKKNFKDFRKRYGADAKNVMYATATKMAMKEDTPEWRRKLAKDRKAYWTPERVKAAQDHANSPEEKARRAKSYADNVAKNRKIQAEIEAAKKKRDAMKESHYPTQGSSVEYPKYKEMDMDNLVQDAIKDIPEDDGPHTSNISDMDAINFQTVAKPEDVVNQPNNEGNRESTAVVASRKTGKPFKAFRSRGPTSYGPEDLSGAVASVAIGEEVEEADRGEYDYEGDMAKSSLKTIIRNAQLMHDMLGEDTNLPEWVQGKITLAEDYIVSAAQYMQSEMKEEVELEEGSYNPEPARQSSNKRMVKKGKAGRERNAQQYMKNMMLPRSQRKSAPIKGTDKHGNRFVKHVSGPYMGEETVVKKTNQE